LGGRRDKDYARKNLVESRKNFEDVGGGEAAWRGGEFRTRVKGCAIHLSKEKGENQNRTNNKKNAESSVRGKKRKERDRLE